LTPKSFWTKTEFNRETYSEVVQGRHLRGLKGEWLRMSETVRSHGWRSPSATRTCSSVFQTSVTTRRLHQHSST